ncbi:hypothetical protein PLANPX_5331 [Lacipirellula parvula]|uniref:Uncharacterized protein n=1 Tax=Lacipirellula parvula TaxID=2650471 RepID=A0A5K7XQ83_9BACT|nr:hypothetical protein PLANPX_5331 [Lacipirellula parvula]
MLAAFYVASDLAAGQLNGERGWSVHSPSFCPENQARMLLTASAANLPSALVAEFSSLGSL